MKSDIHYLKHNHHSMYTDIDEISNKIETVVERLSNLVDVIMSSSIAYHK